MRFRLYFRIATPHAAKFVDENFMSETAQVFYGVIVLCVTVSNSGADNDYFSYSKPYI